MFDDETTNGEWERISVTAYLPTTGMNNIIVGFQLINVTGTAYFDCAQVEKGEGANDYNLLENSFFENGTTTWETGASNSGTVITATGTKPSYINKSFKINGAAASNYYVSQVVYINSLASQTALNISGYAKIILHRFDYPPSHSR